MTKPNCKNYIAVFDCFATTAVHIELVTDWSKESCILALKQFISRRGLPEKLFSDNGSNFIGARKDLMKVRAIPSKDSGGNCHRLRHTKRHPMGDNTSSCASFRRSLGSGCEVHEATSKTQCWYPDSVIRRTQHIPHPKRGRRF